MKPCWRKIHHLSPVTINCQTCHEPLGRGDRVFWMPATRKGVLVPRHRGFFWCSACGEAVAHKVQGAKVHRHHNDA